MAAVTLNRLPAPTFGWLGVNEAEAEVITAPQMIPEIAVPQGISVTGGAPQTDTESSALAALFAAHQIDAYTVSGSASEAVRLQISERGAAGFRIAVPRSGQMTVIMQMQAEESAVRTVVQAEAYAKIKLVQVITGGRTAAELDAQLDECAELELVQVYLGGDTVSGITVSMNGRKSVFTSHIGYLLDGDDRLDINLNTIQNGAKSVSDTDVKGVLRGRADKIFRGTVDFRHGAVGAKGAEREDVLLMQPTVRNKTVPVILCAEEDVEGSHGASVGQLDARHMFYLQSRGIPTERIYEMMAQAKLGSIIRQIGDAETERAVNRMLGKEESDEP